MNAKTIYLHALTSVHSGTGQTSVGVIDLPIAREKATNYPILPATSLKGVVRSESSGLDEETRNKLFGFISDDGSLSGAGSIAFTDQRLLCLPVRSYFGTFAYATCPLILTRLISDHMAFDLPKLFDPPKDLNGICASLPKESKLTDTKKTLYIEDLDIPATNDDATTRIAQALSKVIFTGETAQTAFVQRFALLSDTVFDYLAETAMEVTAHIALEGDTKTVKTGGLWYEETVPAEAIFAGLLYAANADAVDLMTLTEKNADTPTNRWKSKCW